MPTIISGNQTYSNTSLAMNDNTSASVTGNNDIITIGNNDNLTLFGTNHNLTVTGSVASHVTASNDKVTLSDAAQLYLYGNTNTVVINSNSAITVTGNNNDITASGTTGTTTRLYVNGYNTVNVATNAKLTVNANSDILNVGNNATLSVIGTSNTVNATGTTTTSHIYLSSNTINVLDNGKTAVGGNTNTISIGNSANVGVTGNGNIITANSTTTTSTLTITGTNTVKVVDNGKVTVNGNGDTINLGNNDTVTVSGGGNTINATYSDPVAIDGNGGLIYSGNNQPVDPASYPNLYVGSDGNLFIAHPNNDHINLKNTNGNADILNVSGSAYISLADNTQATIYGGLDTITLGNNDTLTVNGGENTITGGNANTITVAGFVNTMSISNSTIHINTPAPIPSLSGTYSADIITGSNNVITSVADNNNISLTGNNNSATTSGANDFISLTGDNTSFTATGSNSRLNSSGNGNTISLTGANASLSSSGSNNNFTLSSGNSTLTVTGTNNSVAANNDTINQNSAGTLTVNGDGNTLHGVADSYITDNYNAGNSAVYHWVKDTDQNIIETIDDYSGANATGSLTDHQTIAYLAVGTTYTASNISIVGNGGNNIVIGDHDIITTNGYMKVIGSNNDITSTSANNMITVDGDNNTVTANDDQVNIYSKNGLTVIGDGNSFDADGGSTLTNNLTNGTSVLYSWSGDLQYYGGYYFYEETAVGYSGANGSGSVLPSISVSIVGGTSFVGSGDTITTKDWCGITGSNNVIIANSFGGRIGVNGSGNTFSSANNQTIVLGTADLLTVTGDNNVFIGVLGSSIIDTSNAGTSSTTYTWTSWDGNAGHIVENITHYAGAGGTGSVTGSNQIYNINLDGNATVTTSSNVINVNSISTVNVIGTSNTINLTNLDGVHSTGNTVVMAAYDSVIGDNNTITFNPSQSGYSNTIQGNGNTISAGQANYIVGDANTISITQPFASTVIGTANAITIAADCAVYISGNTNIITGSHAQITFNSADTLTVNGDNDTFTAVAGAHIINNHSDGTSVVYTWDANDVQSCESWSGLNGTGTSLGSSADPLILSLNGSKVQTTSLADSQAYFDVQNNGQAVHTAWAAAGEGILVYNPANPDGPVTQDSQLVGSFAALKRLDSNNDATLSSQDAAWQDLRVWVSSGTATGGSLDTLDQLGISAINLNATATNISSNGNTILADSSFTWADGSTGDIAGVALAYDRSSVDQLVSALASFAPAPAATSAFAANDTLTQPQLLAAAH